MVDISSIRDSSRLVPSGSQIDDSPLETAHLLAHPTEQEAFEIAASFPAQTVLALYLDDTLLAISYRNAGRYDEATPETTAWYQSLVPGASLEIFEESAHMTMLEEPERYVQVIRDFLSRAEGR